MVSLSRRTSTVLELVQIHDGDVGSSSSLLLRLDPDVVARSEDDGENRGCSTAEKKGKEEMGDASGLRVSLRETRNGGKEREERAW